MAHGSDAGRMAACAAVRRPLDRLPPQCSSAAAGPATISSASDCAAPVFHRAVEPHNIQCAQRLDKTASGRVGRSSGLCASGGETAPPVFSSSQSCRLCTACALVTMSLLTFSCFPTGVPARGAAALLGWRCRNHPWPRAASRRAGISRVRTGACPHVAPSAACAKCGQH